MCDVKLTLRENRTQARVSFTRPNGSRRQCQPVKLWNTTIVISVADDLMAIAPEQICFSRDDDIFAAWLLVVVVNLKNPQADSLCVLVSWW